VTPPRWRTTIPQRHRRFDLYDVLTFRVTKRYLPAALACTPPGCTPATPPDVRVHLIDSRGRSHAEAAGSVLSALPPVRRPPATIAGQPIDLTKYHYETWQVELSRYSSVRLREIRFVELEVSSQSGQPIYIDTLSLVKRA
jgi:hypothetical protein